jgi:hypothetical protein
MSDQVEVQVTAGLIDKTELHAIIVHGTRTFNAQLSLAGTFAVQSDDLLPIPLPVLWYGYLEMHKMAVYMRTGNKPDNDDPVNQILVRVVDNKPLQDKLGEADQQ